MTEPEIRQLTYADLPQVIAIERRAFPTPWSLAMFVLELSKQNGICLAALVDGKLVGYVVCSRYDTVWHLMNVAIDPSRRRQGIASALLERLFELGDRPGGAVHARGADLEPGRNPPVRALRLPRSRTQAGLLPRQPRGRAHHVADGAGTRHRVILAIETSCDDTCAAVVTEDGEIRSNVIASQGLLHARYGGVVPEIASRHHLELVDAVTADALERGGVELDGVDTVAVTHGPGLIGALLVGLSSAKALAAARRLPLVPVDHLHGHVVASTLGPEPVQTPYLCLVASGGHTFLARVEDPARYTVLGQTLDDAAGEAFDKGARLLGLGYPGGPAVDRLARDGDPDAFEFPVSAPGELDFSFSGLKTSLLYRIRDLGDEADSRAPDLAASYQRAIVDALTARTAAALEREGLERLAIGGGVAANSRLREAVGELGVPVWVPPVELCTDNAAMIAGAARFLEPLAYPAYLDLDASARLA